MQTARATRTIAAPPEQLWGILSDPYHLPRWWPRVLRVEDVAGGAFTEVMKTAKGKTVRADFDVLQSDRESGTVIWEQRLEGTPFANVLSHSQTELHVAESAGSTEVTIEMRQELSGRAAAGSPVWGLSMPSVGGWMLRRAAGRTISEALSGLEEISA
jgi:uncharacterized protein YndB with AHSA1/START domain